MENSTRTEIHTEIDRLRKGIAQRYESLRIAEAGHYTEVAERTRASIERMERKLSDLRFQGVGRN